MESHLKVSDMGRPALLIGTRRISIAESPDSVVNILNTRMRNPRSSGGAMLPQAARAHAETQIDAVLHRDGSAQERVGRDAEVGLVEREPPGHAQLAGIGVDYRRRLQR